MAYYSHFFKEKEEQFESTCISSFFKRQVVTKICTRLNFILTLLNEFAFVTSLTILLCSIRLFQISKQANFDSKTFNKWKLFRRPCYLPSGWTRCSATSVRTAWWRWPRWEPWWGWPRLQSSTRFRRKQSSLLYLHDLKNQGYFGNEKVFNPDY